MLTKIGYNRAVFGNLRGLDTDTSLSYYTVTDRIFRDQANIHGIKTAPGGPQGLSAQMSNSLFVQIEFHFSLHNLIPPVYFFYSPQ